MEEKEYKKLKVGDRVDLNRTPFVNMKFEDNIFDIKIVDFIGDRNGGILFFLGRDKDEKITLLGSEDILRKI